MDPKFRTALLREAVESYLNGDLETGEAVLRDYVNATVGFQALEGKTNIPGKSLMRMIGPKGSPSAAKLATILAALQKAEGVHFNWRCGTRPPHSTTSRTHPRKSISNSIVSIGGREGYHTTPCVFAPPIGPNTSRSQKSPKLKTV